MLLIVAIISGIIAIIFLVAYFISKCVMDAEKRKVKVLGCWAIFFVLLFFATCGIWAF